MHRDGVYRGTFRNQGVLDVKQVVDVGAKLADALDAIHEEGIVHRDIKPHNVFVSDGASRRSVTGISSIETERTVTGAAGFSVNYAPPEAFEEGGAEAPGDVYALGATLYQLATGKCLSRIPGPESDRLRATVHKIITAPPAVAAGRRCAEALDRLLRRCMAKRPEDRPASAREVAAESVNSAGGGFPEVGSITPAGNLDRSATPANDDDATVGRRSQPTNTRTVCAKRRRGPIRQRRSPT